MEKNQKVSPPNKYEKTSTVRIDSSKSKSDIFRKMENSSSSDVFHYYNSSLWTVEPSDLNFTSFYPAFNGSEDWSNSSNGQVEKKCQWEAAQHNLFQFSNICFLSAFLMPRHYKASILFFRILLSVSFVVSAIWAGVHFCALDWFIWNTSLALTNSVHAIVLTFKFLPPALSLELTELYIRMFKPLKVSKKHFKELTKEACLLRLATGETYAIEEVTPADEKLSILLKGRLKVTCNGAFLHNISSYQFIDSPEWRANTSADGTMFQVTITAEEDSVYLCWQRLKLDQILRHRNQIKFIVNNLIGKDITHKMYSLNEQVGHICTTEALSKAAKEDHWRRSMNRSVSVDAVDTGTRGHVRSNAWKQSEKCRKDSTHSEYESLLPNQQYWFPFVASQFPQESPFIVNEDDLSFHIDEEKEPMLKYSKKQDIELLSKQGQQLQISSTFSKTESNMQPLSLLNVVSGNSLQSPHPVALIPVIVPVLTTTASNSTKNSVTVNSCRPPSLKRQKGVKFDETKL